MKVSQLIEKLSMFDPDAEVVFLYDDRYGSGIQACDASDVIGGITANLILKDVGASVPNNTTVIILENTI